MDKIHKKKIEKQKISILKVAKHDWSLGKYKVKSPRDIPLYILEKIKNIDNLVSI